MNWFSSWNTLLLSAFLLLCSLAASLAQPETNQPPARDQNQPRPDRPRTFNGSPGAGRFGPLGERLVNLLTQEQRTSLRKAMEENGVQLRQLDQKFRTARREMLEASLAQPFDETAYRQKAMAAAKIEIDLAVLRAKAMSKIDPPLSAEQLDQLKSIPEPNAPPQERPERKSRFDGPRDENGLPPKDRVPPEKSSAPAPK
jgi:Spy/CpxP family protein refolding chaperone